MAARHALIRDRRQLKRIVAIGSVTAAVVSAFATAPAASFAQNEHSDKSLKGQQINYSVGALHRHTPKGSGADSSGGSADGSAGDGTTDMTYHGGSVMRDVTNYVIFWDPSPKPAGYPAGQSMFGATFRNTIDRYFNDIGGTPYYNILTQYGDNTGAPVPNQTQFGGDWIDTAPLPHAGTWADPLGDSDIDASITRAIAANPTWQTDPLSTMYFVYTGNGVIECSGTDSKNNNAQECFAAQDYTGANADGITKEGFFCAYHWSNGSQIYGYIPYAGEGGCYTNPIEPGFPNGADQDRAITATSHEEFEANTDPYGDGWYDNVDNHAGENGDKCAYNESPFEDDGTNLVLNGHAYQIQKEWSNASPHGCVKRYGAQPNMQITGDLDFGTVKRGTSATKQVAVENTGSGVLDLLDVKLGSGTDPAYTLTPAAPNRATLAQGDTALYNVKFSPPAGASSSSPLLGSLVIDSDNTQPNNTGQPTNAQLTDVQTVAATGTPGIPQVKVSGSLNFGTVPRGSSASRNVVVQNIGTGDLNISNVALGFGSDPAYSLSPSSPTSGTLPPGGSLVAQVTFAPPASATSAGPDTGSLVVTTDDPGNASVSVPATGTVGLPKAAVSPGSINFGVVCPGSFADQQLTVTNTGTAPLTINNITIASGSSSGLSVLPIPGLPQTLAVGASLSFTVRFAPTGPLGGPIAGAVDVNTDDPNNPDVTVPITGSVGAAVVTLGSNLLDFGGVATDNRTSPNSNTLPLTVSNSGNCSLSVNSLSVSGPAASDFSLVGAPSTPLTIGPGSSITLSVKFNPSAAGTRNGTLTIASSDPSTPSATVALTGKGLLPAILTSPSSLTYAPTVIQSQAPGYAGSALSTHITNTGQSELIVDTLATSGAPFSATGPASPPSRYATNDGFTEPVTFAPTSVGKFTGALNVSDNDPEGGASASVPLCGEGVQRGIRVLAVNASGVPFSSISQLKLQSQGTAQKVNDNVKNLALTNVTTSCRAGEQMQYQNQGLPTTDTTNQRSSYYTLSLTAGGKSTTVTFTLGIAEFKTMVITIK